MSKLNFYIGGKLIGTSTPVKMPVEKNKWEFYLRRKGVYFFRRAGSRVKAELEFFGEKAEELKRMKYGTFYELEYNIEKQAYESRN